MSGLPLMTGECFTGRGKLEFQLLFTHMDDGHPDAPQSKEVANAVHARHFRSLGRGKIFWEENNRITAR